MKLRKPNKTFEYYHYNRQIKTPLGKIYVYINRLKEHDTRWRYSVYWAKDDGSEETIYLNRSASSPSLRSLWKAMMIGLCIWFRDHKEPAKWAKTSEICLGRSVDE